MVLVGHAHRETQGVPERQDAVVRYRQPQSARRNQLGSRPPSDSSYFGVDKANTMISTVCKQCGVIFYRERSMSSNTGKPLRFCSQKCNGLSRRGAAHYNFKSGSHISPYGYVMTTSYGHPRSSGHRVLAHVLLAEKALGRPLPEHAEVHHFDGNKANNSPGNLVICQDRAYHALLHARARRLKDCGSLDVKRCPRCKIIKQPSAFYVSAVRWDRLTQFCKECDFAMKQERRQKQLLRPVPLTL